ncbi:MAG: hypothetical protein GX061_08835, partial [Eubacteriaceae bacterium]|nr:hypothetical protein [Eubacteriaceae bacterium]
MIYYVFRKGAGGPKTTYIAGFDKLESTGDATGALQIAGDELEMFDLVYIHGLNFHETPIGDIPLEFSADKLFHPAEKGFRPVLKPKEENKGVSSGKAAAKSRIPDKGRGSSVNPATRLKGSGNKGRIPAG